MKPISPQSKDEYLVPAAEVESEIKVKGSRFLATIIPVESREKAEAEYDRIREKYYNATHNCLAYRINSDNFRYYDDGEPSGTAGKPILQIIDGYTLSKILCVVTRYFGGTKLGTGGLIRAYGDAAREAIKRLQIKKQIRRIHFELLYNYELENPVRRLLDEMGGIILNEKYDENVRLTVGIPLSLSEQFNNKLYDTAMAKIKITVLLREE